MNKWLLSYFRDWRCLRAGHDGPVHVLLCIADHFEPQNGNVAAAVARERVKVWAESYPRLFERFGDSDGQPPRHTFFYPAEQYDSYEMEGLEGLCRRGFGEVEVHLHHHNDTAERLTETLRGYKELLSKRHGLLARHRKTGELKYGFVHGNWALDNSRPDGKYCGVNNELDVLRRTGCYADFTMPSAPSATQTSKINSIYYAVDDPARPKSHDTGVDLGKGPAPADSLMLIQGPLLLNWRRRKFGLLPRLENGCLQGNQPPTGARLDLWLRAQVQVPARADWFFVKLHTHGAPEQNQKVLLGPAMVEFHEELARRAKENANFHFHYVTAREMYNLAKAAEAGWRGNVSEARDFELVWNGSIASATAAAYGGAA
jgi:hypothetical protein